MKKAILSKYSLTADSKDSSINYHIKYDDYPIYHNHDYFELLIVLDGKYEHELNGERFIISNGDAIFLRPFDCHTFKSLTKQVKHLNIMIKKTLFKKMCSIYSENLYDKIISKTKYKFNLSNLIINELISNLHDFSLEKNNEKKQVLEKIIVNIILNKIINESDNYGLDAPGWFKDLLLEIENSGKIKSVMDIAKLSNYTLTHLERLFKKYLGVTIIQYLNKLKINTACSYLLYSNKSISQISNELGFNDVSHFSNLFKKITNYTPLQFKKNNSKDYHYESI